MEQKIWYCSDDDCIFPDENTARECYKKWCQFFDEPFDEEIFLACYCEITFDEFNHRFNDIVGYENPR